MTTSLQSPRRLPIVVVPPLIVLGLVGIVWAGWVRREPGLIARTQARLS